jgi:hypothetical protein
MTSSPLGVLAATVYPAATQRPSRAEFKAWDCSQETRALSAAYDGNGRSMVTAEGLSPGYPVLRPFTWLFGGVPNSALRPSTTCRGPDEPGHPAPDVRYPVADLTSPSRLEESPRRTEPDCGRSHIYAFVPRTN